MKVRLTKSKNKEKKYRVTFPDGKHVEFGAEGYDDYTTHKKSLRMRSYVRRHGGLMSKSLSDEDDEEKVHKRMLSVNRSDKEDWSKKGIYTAGFWSRWYLWSGRTKKEAKEIISKKFNIDF